MAKFGWCLFGGPHAKKCPRRVLSMGRWIECSCPCHLETDEALKELI